MIHCANHVSILSWKHLEEEKWNICMNTHARGRSTRSLSLKWVGFLQGPCQYYPSYWPCSFAHSLLWQPSMLLYGYATFPDGCVWMPGSVRWFLGLYACYDYDIINTHSKWESEQTRLVRMRRGLFINKMHSLKLCRLLWLISPGETEPSRPLHWPWRCPG